MAAICLENGDYGADIPLANDGPVIFAFDNAGEAHNALETRRGWGFDFLCSHGFDAVSFSEGDPDAWFRRDSFLPIFKEAVARVDAWPCCRHIGYGASMGAFAAAAFSDVLRCDRLVLISPISTLDEALAPWEHRSGAAREHGWSGPRNDSAAVPGPGTEIAIAADP
ncbi:hypothetical protein [Mangrovicoccus sp. HB161399]|uniref:hypothetical protein n=1 Tax=Mangrovicoccus sp. HB161399 TaxID=2720392 RepID=UPI001554710E|nr:hypothetical protein [Mangrovicoccus sp. HB161399]